MMTANEDRQNDTTKYREAPPLKKYLLNLHTSKYENIINN